VTDRNSFYEIFKKFGQMSTRPRVVLSFLYSEEAEAGILRRKKRRDEGGWERKKKKKRVIGGVRVRLSRYKEDFCHW